MTKATKKTLIDLAKIFGGMGLLFTLMITIPNGSFAQKVLGFFMVATLIVGIVWFTAIGNPLKKLIRKYKAKK